jgi:hypothetical protein
VTLKASYGVWILVNCHENCLENKKITDIKLMDVGHDCGLWISSDVIRV